MKWKRLIGSSVAYTGLDFLQRGSKFFLLPVLTAYLSTAEFGMLSLLATTGAILSPLILMGQSNATMRYYYEFDVDQDRQHFLGSIWSYVFVVYGVFAVPAMLISFWSAAPTLFGLPVVLIRLMIIHLGLALVFVLSSQVLRLAHRSVSFSLISVLQTITSIGGILLLVVYYEKGVYGKYVAECIAAFVVAVYGLWLMRSHLRWNLDLKPFLKSFRFGVFLVPHVLCLSLLQGADLFVLEKYLGVSEVGVYSLGYTISTTLSLLYFGIEKAVSPFFFSSSKNSAERKHYTAINTIVIGVLALCGVGLIVFAREITTLMNASYAAAQTVIPIATAGMFIYTLSSTPSKILHEVDRTPLLAYASIVCAVVNLVLNLVLIPRFGMIAAAYTTLASYALYTAILLVITQRIKPFPYEYRRLAGVCLSALICILIAFQFPEASMFTWTTLAKLLCVLSTYPIFLYLFGFFSARPHLFEPLPNP